VAEESRRPREEQIGEHDYARAPRFSWPGEVRIGDGAQQRVIPGTWQLEWQPRALVRVGVADALPEISDATAWAERMSRIVTLREPGLQLRVAASDANGWRTLEVTVPTTPPRVVEFDQEALASLTGYGAVSMRVLA
jgi:hypothetical protein